MPETLAPASPEELRDTLRRCGDEQASLETGGSFSKRLVGGPVADSRYRLETGRLNRLLAYEPADLTVSVEAGMTLAELNRILAEGNQFLPLDPPWAGAATIGGVVAANSSGPLRRRYGTARDLVIGMRFATLDGRLVSTGGMVVKNVTGLDMAKLMIGSFGTLAVIASVNFKAFPKPESSATFRFQSPAVEPLLGIRREILRGILQPNAIDILDTRAARAAGVAEGPALLAEASGTESVTRRFREEFASLASKHSVDFDALSPAVWEGVRDCEPGWLAEHPRGAVVRAATVHSRLGELLELADRSGCGALLRAGNATGALLAADAEGARRAMTALRSHGIHGRLEAASEAVKRSMAQWRAGGPELELMQRIKADFDPLSLLNSGRLYGAI